MPTVNRTWGSGSYTPVIAGLEQNALYGQTALFGCIQNLPAQVDQAGLTIMQTDSLDVLANAISLGTHGQTKLINFSFNYAPNGTTFLLTDFVIQIAVQVVSNDYPVNVANIQNALVGTFLEYLVTAPVGMFNTQAWISGQPQTPPAPGDIVIPGLSEETKQKLLAWIDQKPTFAISTDPTYTPFQAAQSIYRNVPVGIQDEDRFSPVGSFAFSPLTQTMSDFQNVALVSILAAMSRSERGREMIFHLAEKYVDNVTKMLVAITESGKASPLTALNASTQWATLAHRFGLITDAHYLKMADQTRSLMDKTIQMSWTDSIFTGLSSLVEKTDITTTEGAGAIWNIIKDMEATRQKKLSS